jgi:hypothetical protein
VVNQDRYRVSANHRRCVFPAELLRRLSTDVVNQDRYRVSANHRDVFFPQNYSEGSRFFSRGWRQKEPPFSEIPVSHARLPVCPCGHFKRLSSEDEWNALQRRRRECSPSRPYKRSKVRLSHIAALACRTRVRPALRSFALAVQSWLGAILDPDIGEAISVRLFCESEVSTREFI